MSGEIKNGLDEWLARWRDASSRCFARPGLCCGRRCRVETLGGPGRSEGPHGDVGALAHSFHGFGARGRQRRSEGPDGPETG